MHCVIVHRPVRSSMIRCWRMILDDDWLGKRLSFKFRRVAVEKRFKCWPSLFTADQRLKNESCSSCRWFGVAFHGLRFSLRSIEKRPIPMLISEVILHVSIDVQICCIHHKSNNTNRRVNDWLRKWRRNWIKLSSMQSSEIRGVSATFANRDSNISWRWLFVVYRTRVHLVLQFGGTSKCYIVCIEKSWRKSSNQSLTSHWQRMRGATIVGCTSSASRHTSTRILNTNLFVFRSVALSVAPWRTECGSLFEPNCRNWKSSRKFDQSRRTTE